jgi:UDP-N-acetylglucosamine 2-epimerase
VPLTYWLENAYLGELATITDQMARARDIIETLRPDLVVVGNDRWWLGQSYVQAAQTAGVPTLWVQDGIPIDSPVYFWMRADRLAASSEWVPEVLARYGIAPDRYQVTGQPRYDKLVAMARTVDRDASRQKLGLVPGRRYALLATQPLQSPAYAREVLEALLRVPDLFILLRPHPSQPREDLTELMATMPADRVSFHPGDSVFDLLAACDLMVNQFSTVTIEAAILGRPTITANFSGIPDPVPFARFGLSTAARSMADITTVTQRILDDGGAGFRATEEGMRRLVGPTDEGSARRVAEIIAGMVPA